MWTLRTLKRNKFYLLTEEKNRVLWKLPNKIKNLCINNSESKSLLLNYTYVAIHTLKTDLKIFSRPILLEAFGIIAATLFQ